MTMDDFRMLTAYWAEHPPVHVLLGMQTSKPAGPHNNLATFLGADMASEKLQTLRL